MNKDLSRYSLKHRIAQEIRNLIYQGKLAPEEKITENRLSQDLGVSRTSVREAILLLELEGLLISSPYKDTRVAKISQEEVMELLLPMRVHIETYALKKGFENWGEAHKETFKNIVENMRKAVNYDDLLTFIDLDIQLHELIVTASEMENVIRIWESIVHRIRLHFVYQNSKSGTLEKWLKDHEELVDIFVTVEDTDMAAEALRKHIIDTNIPDVYLLN